METARFESPVINNLRVVGSLDYNGKITRQYRCWATFKKDESTTLVTTGAQGSRVIIGSLPLASAVPSRVVEGFLFCDGRPFSAFCASLHLSNHENP